MVGIQIGKEQEERKSEEEGLNFETTPWWNFITIMGYADEELRSASLLKLRAQPTAKAKAIYTYAHKLWKLNPKSAFFRRSGGYSAYLYLIRHYTILIGYSIDNIS